MKTYKYHLITKLVNGDIIGETRIEVAKSKKDIRESWRNSGSKVKNLWTAEVFDYLERETDLGEFNGVSEKKIKEYKKLRNYHYSLRYYLNL